MDLTGIISISGKPGLFKIVAQSKSAVIVENIKDKKRFPAHSRHKISALEDISIYTYDEDLPLKEVYTKLFDHLDGKKAINHKEDSKKLRDEMDAFLPDYDESRVYDSDIKKLFQWYNLLHDADLLKKEEEEEEENTDEKSEKSTDKETKETKKPAAKKKATTAKKAEPKKSGAKKATDKKSSVASKTKSKASSSAKNTGAKKTSTGKK